ncbi:MAG: peroxiredoxin [Thermoplasmatales archaeon]|nr:peroxiredoxin [Thermoplasmatales archaeon]
MEGETTYSMPLIGDKAPEFKAVTTQGNINFPADFKGKWVVLFSHPADFTPVCTTEFMTLAHNDAKFKELNAQLVGLSIDGIHSHVAWLRRIKDLEWNGMKNVDVAFPLIEDIKMDVAKKYGMIQPKQSTTEAVRAVFFIDPNGIIRCILYYPMSTGRNLNEMLRILRALQKADKDKVATPMNWHPGDDVIVPAPSTCGDAEKRVKDKDLKCVDWFLCFKADKN